MLSQTFYSQAGRNSDELIALQAAQQEKMEAVARVQEELAPVDKCLDEARRLREIVQDRGMSRDIATHVRDLANDTRMMLDDATGDNSTVTPEERHDDREDTRRDVPRHRERDIWDERGVSVEHFTLKPSRTFKDVGLEGIGTYIVEKIRKLTKAIIDLIITLISKTKELIKAIWTKYFSKGEVQKMENTVTKLHLLTCTDTISETNDEPPHLPKKEYSVTDSDPAYQEKKEFTTSDIIDEVNDKTQSSHEYKLVKGGYTGLIKAMFDNGDMGRAIRAVFMDIAKIEGRLDTRRDIANNIVVGFKFEYDAGQVDSFFAEYINPYIQSMMPAEMENNIAQVDAVIKNVETLSEETLDLSEYTLDKLLGGLREHNTLPFFSDLAYYQPFRKSGIGDEKVLDIHETTLKRLSKLMSDIDKKDIVLSQEQAENFKAFIDHYRQDVDVSFNLIRLYVRLQAQYKTFLTNTGRFLDFKRKVILNALERDGRKALLKGPQYKLFDKYYKALKQGRSL